MEHGVGGRLAAEALQGKGEQGGSKRSGASRTLPSPQKINREKLAFSSGLGGEDSKNTVESRHELFHLLR